MELSGVLSFLFDDSDGSESYKLFDGDTSVLYSPGASTITFDITSIGGITVSTSLEVYYSSGAASRNFSVNGGSTVASGTGTKWVDLGFTGTFNTLTGTNGGQIGAIRIDGTTILTDPARPVGNAAATNFNTFITDIKTVRGQETGYCTLNPLWKNSNTSNSGGTFADGNLNHTTAGSNGNTPTCANIYASSGKFYWEVTLTSGSAFGIGVASDIFSSADYPGYGTGAANGQVSWGYNQNGVKIHNATSTSSYGSSYTVGDTIGVAMNLDTGELEYYKNGVSQGVAFTDLEGNLTACHADTGSAARMSPLHNTKTLFSSN